MRRFLTALVVVVVLAALALAGGGWYYANELLPAPAPKEPSENIRVESVAGSMITLRADSDAEAKVHADLSGDHIVGFEHPGGYVQLSGAPAVADDGTTTRSFEVVAGTLPSTGDRGDVHPYAYPGQPTSLGLPVDEVVAPGPLGDLPGWRFRADGPTADRWVVFVHGRGATRAEALRAVDVVVRQAGWSAVVISYRNDEGTASSPDGFGHFGDAEWEDLDAWLSWLDDAEAPTEVALFGFSQGGSVVAVCLRRCDHLDDVTGAILDSPLLSMTATLELQAANRGIPGPLIGPLLASTRVVSSLRGGPDFSNLEHVQALVDLDLPILAFHGRRDTSVPFGPTEELQFLDGEQVTLESHDGGHVRAWNHQRQRYEEAVATFLSRS